MYAKLQIAFADVKIFVQIQKEYVISLLLMFYGLSWGCTTSQNIFTYINVYYIWFDNRA